MPSEGPHDLGRGHAPLWQAAPAHHARRSSSFLPTTRRTGVASGPALADGRDAAVPPGDATTGVLPRCPVLPPVPDGVHVDTDAGTLKDAAGDDLPVDEVTGLPVHGEALLDPYTGRPLTPVDDGGAVVDPVTGLLLDPRTGMFSDPGTGQRLETDDSSSFLVHPLTGHLVAQDTGLHYDPVSGRLVDPGTGAPLRIDPASGLIVDRVTGESMDPETGRLVDRSTGRPLPRDLDSGFLLVGSLLLDPRTGVRYDRDTRRPLVGTFATNAPRSREPADAP